MTARFSDKRRRTQEQRLHRARQRAFVDRRSGDDRRERYSLDYFSDGGVERRHSRGDRRQAGERRNGWMRVTPWSSVLTKEEEDDAPDSG